MTTTNEGANMNVQLTDAEQEALFDAGWKQLQADLLVETATNKALAAELTGYPSYLTPEEAEAIGAMPEPAFEGVDLIELAIASVLDRDEGSENDPRNYPEYYEKREQ